MPEPVHPPRLRVALITAGIGLTAVWIVGALWLIGSRGSPQPATPPDTEAASSEMEVTVPEQQTLAPVGGKDIHAAVPTQLPVTTDPETFARAIAGQLWSGDDRDAVAFRVMDRADAGISDAELDALAEQVDEVLTGHPRSGVEAVGIEDSTGLDDAITLHVSGDGTAVSLRVRCAPDCLLQAVGA